MAGPGPSTTFASWDDFAKRLSALVAGAEAKSLPATVRVFVEVGANPDDGPDAKPTRRNLVYDSDPSELPVELPEALEEKPGERPLEWSVPPDLVKWDETSPYVEAWKVYWNEIASVCAHVAHNGNGYGLHTTITEIKGDGGIQTYIVALGSKVVPVDFSPKANEDKVEAICGNTAEDAQ